MENPPIFQFGKPSISMGHGLTMAMSAITRWYLYLSAIETRPARPGRRRSRSPRSSSRRERLGEAAEGHGLSEGAEALWPNLWPKRNPGKSMGKSMGKW